MYTLWQDLRFGSRMLLKQPGFTLVAVVTLPVNAYIVGDVRPALVALLVAVTLVLLIAAVNVANLTLVRAASRVKEISIRTALGASRGRIVRRVLTESLLLAIAGGGLGTLSALWGVSLLVRFAPENLPRLDQIRIDGIVKARAGASLCARRR